MKAFSNFKEIEKLDNIQAKHRAWLRDYEGCIYSIAQDTKHLMKWATDPQKYKDMLWSPRINCMGRHKRRTVIEFDGDKVKAKESLEKVAIELKNRNWGYIRSSHEGKSDYLWVEFESRTGNRLLQKR